MAIVDERGGEHVVIGLVMEPIMNRVSGVTEQEPYALGRCYAAATVCYSPRPADRARTIASARLLT